MSTGNDLFQEDEVDGALASTRPIRVALVHANDGSDVRIGKTCRSLSRLGFDTFFIGWNRRLGPGPAVELGNAAARALIHATPNGRWSATGQLAFFAHILRELWAIRPDVVCAVNEELAFLLLPFKGWLYKRLVCEAYDSLDTRLPATGFLKHSVLGAVASLARRFSDRLIVTDENRLSMIGSQAAKTRVIENLPEDPGPALSEHLPQGPVKIWAAGTLDESHGLRQLLRSVETLDDVLIVSAGWPCDDFAAHEFLGSPRVQYNGVVSADVALQLAAGCDAVFCCYAPTNLNMINASPNKVHDALAVGRPILINSEVKISRWIVDNHVGYSFAYNDVSALRSVISRLATERASLSAFASRSRMLFGQRSWAYQETVLASLYRELAGMGR